MNTSIQIYKKSKKFLIEDNCSSYWGKKINFIQKLNGISVICFINVGIGQIIFTIVSKYNLNHKLFGYVFKLKEYNHKYIEEFVSKTKQILLNIKFDSVIGIFISDLVNYDAPIFYNEFGTDFIEKDKCVKCENITINKLTCNHFCCMKCWESLDSTSNRKCCNCNKKSLKLKKIIDYYPFELQEKNFIQEMQEDIIENTDDEGDDGYDDDDDDDDDDDENYEDWDGDGDGDGDDDEDEDDGSDM